jgi:hypothetical protein
LGVGLAFALFFAFVPSAYATGFGIEPGSLKITPLATESGIPAEAASSHPYSWNLSFNLNADSEGHSLGGELRDDERLRRI